MRPSTFTHHRRVVAATMLLAAAAGWALPRTRSGRRDRRADRSSRAWRVLGPGGGGTMTSPAVSPHDPARMMVGCDMSGAYLTRDAGESWAMLNFGTAPTAFAYDPARPSTIYVGASALWRSDDGGRAWRMVLPDPARGTRVDHRTDDADLVIASDDPNYPRGATWVRVDAIALDRSRPDDLLIALRARLPSGVTTHLLASTDRGRRWALRRALDGARVLALDLRRGEALAVTEGGVWAEAGGAWSARPFPSPATSASAARDGARRILYATLGTAWEGGALRGGVRVSDDDGRSWRDANAGLLGDLWRPGEGAPPRLEPVAASRHHGAHAYIGFRGLRTGDGPSRLFNGIARTRDAGRSWEIVHRESDAPSGRLDGTWLDARAPTGGIDIWFDAPQDLAVAPHDPEVCVATDLFRTYRTTDGGATWRQRYARPHGDDRWASRGLDVTTSYEVYADPFSARRRFIAYTDIGLFRSEDGGRSWTGSTDGVPARWRNTTYALAFDPAVPGLVWGAFSDTHDLPRVKMWRERSLASFRGGVGVSRDGGRTWTPASEGLPDAAVTHVLVDPSSPPAARVLHAAVFGHGVFASANGGASWTPMSAGLAGSSRFAWRLARAPDATLYVVVARGADPSDDATAGAVYRWPPSSQRWERLALPTRAPYGLAVDPRDARRLYLAAFAEGAAGEPERGGGVFLSEDGGASWRLALAEVPHAYDVTVDARAPGTVYATGFDRGAWRSTDGGAHWSRMAGFTFQYGHRVVPDPTDPTMVYVTTFGGSVWHGPAAGDADFVDPVRAPR